MATWNKELQGLTLDEINQVSERFLMGWHDPMRDGHKFRIKGLNRRREKFGMPLLTKEWSLQYRIEYVKSHYSYDEIRDTIKQYLQSHLMNDARWDGIEILDCRFGRDYAKAFKMLLGASEWRKVSEETRVEKLMQTQIDEYGGVGVGGKAAYQKMTDTKARDLADEIEAFRHGDNFKKNIFGSLGEEIVFLKLIERFGRNDVYYQYGQHPYDARYPYPCDFYIKSLDLFIELHIHFSHGYHWFDEFDENDINRYEQLKASNNIKNVKSAEIWAVLDLEKKAKAKASGIYYLVFWDHRYYKNAHGAKRGEKTSGAPYYYTPRLSDFYEWLNDFHCDYEAFIKKHPECTY